MRISVGQLRSVVQETKAAASAAYMKKERVREDLQALVAGMVRDGRITDQAGVDEAFQALDMSVKALKMVPFEVWQRLAGPVASQKKR